MASKWKLLGQFGLNAAKAMFPAVAAVEAGVLGLKNAKGEDKLNAAEELAKAGMDLAEDIAGKDLLDEPKVSAAYRGFISSYVQFMNALSDAKAAKVQPPATDPIT